MASCYICGAYIEPNTGYRRRVNTGDSFGISYGRRITPSTRTYYGDRTLCQSCAKLHDRRQTVKFVLFLLAILAFWLFKDNPDSKSVNSDSRSVPEKSSQYTISQPPDIAKINTPKNTRPGDENLSAIQPGRSSFQQAQESDSRQTTAIKKSMRVTAPDELNVRSGPGAKFNVLSKLHSGDSVLVQATENGWSYIGTGWVRSKFLVFDDENNHGK